MQRHDEYEKMAGEYYKLQSKIFANRYDKGTGAGWSEFFTDDKRMRTLRAEMREIIANGTGRC